jgi:hypothetical protein
MRTPPHFAETAQHAAYFQAQLLRAIEVEKTQPEFAAVVGHPDHQLLAVGLQHLVDHGVQQRRVALAVGLQHLARRDVEVLGLVQQLLRRARPRSLRKFPDSA